MKRALAIVLFAAIAAAACGRFGRSAGGDAGAGGTGDPADPGPVMRIEGSQILMDGQLAGSSRAIEELGRLQKIDELFERLKDKREAFKAQNPSTPFPGRATLQADANTTAMVFKSVFQTIAYAGYPNVLVKTPAGVVPVKAIIPGPDSAFSPRVEFHVRVSDGELVLTEERGGSVVHENRLPVSSTDATLSGGVDRVVVDHFLRRDMRTNPIVDVVLHADNRLAFSKLAAALDGLAAAQERLAGPGAEDGAFVVRLAVR